MMDKTATELSMDRMMRPDLRRRRAEVLVAAIMNEVGHLVDDKREFYDRLGCLLMQEGVEVLTDCARAEIGLPPRSGDGWTSQEIAALELRRLELMWKPIPFLAPTQ